MAVAVLLLVLLLGSFATGCRDDSPAGLGNPRTGDIAYICTAEYFVCVVGRDGRDERFVTTKLKAIAFAWSPTGTQMVIATPGVWRFEASQYLGGDDLYLIAADGSAERLTSGEHHDSDPSWSPNASQIAFTSDRDLEQTSETAGAAGSIYILNLADRSIRRLTHGSDDARPAWSPDGTEIAFVRGGDVWITSAGGSRSRRVPLSRPRFPTSVAWSPDGLRIAVGDFEGGIHIVSTDGSENRRLEFAPWMVDEADYPSWSPDGRQLAFAGYPEGRCAAILVSLPSGKATRQVTPCDPEYDVADAPSWRPVHP